MFLALSIFSVLILLMLVGVFWSANVFHTGFFLGTLGALALSVLWCCRRRLSFRNTGFLLAHLGIVLILAGALIGRVWGTRSEVGLPVGTPYGIEEIPEADGQSTALGFGLLVTWFDVEYYARDSQHANRALTPRRFMAGLRIVEKDGSIKDKQLSVNHPVTHNGWRLYLMSYDRETRDQVLLMIRFDPGRNWVMGGIAALMLGIVLMYFRKQENS